jgi:hypothetical protein
MISGLGLGAWGLGMPETLLDRYRPAKVWKTMPSERRLEAARVFWEDEESTDQQAEALLAIATHLKFRPKSAAALSVERLTRYLATLPTVPEGVAARLLVAWHLERQRPMMAEFLDALGVTHTNGLITEDVKPIEAKRLAEAAKALASNHPVDDVRLYFSALISQDPETWGGLADTLEMPNA